MREIVLSKLPKALLYVGDVGGEIGVGDDNFVEVGSDAVEAVDDLVDDFHEPPSRRAASLRHNQPLEKVRGRT